jgi:hypothetical protein
VDFKADHDGALVLYAVFGLLWLSAKVYDAVAPREVHTYRDWYKVAIACRVIFRYKTHDDSPYVFGLEDRIHDG